MSLERKPETLSRIAVQPARFSVVVQDTVASSARELQAA
jgi:hypothetical protein